MNASALRAISTMSAGLNARNVPDAPVWSMIRTGEGRRAPGGAFDTCRIEGVGIDTFNDPSACYAHFIQQDDRAQPDAEVINEPNEDDNGDEVGDEARATGNWGTVCSIRPKAARE